MRETLGGVYGGALGAGRFLVGANMQDRYNPKRKLSQRFDQPGGTLDNIEIQTDDRDGTDYSLNGSFQIPLFGGDFAVDGVFVHTDRTADEDSLEYRSGIVNNANLLTVNDNDVDTEQDSISINTRYSFNAFGGETRLKFGYARFDVSESEFEDENEFLRDAVAYPEVDRYTGEAFQTELTDQEYKAKIEHERELADMTLEVGVHVEYKERENLVEERDPRIRINLPNGTTVQGARPTSGLPALSPFAPVAGGDSTIERRRVDPYVQISGNYEKLDWEAGVRVETTETEIKDRTVGGPSISNDYAIALPSLHLRYNFTENDRVAFSVARTVRNPSAQLLSPALLEAELGDNDFVGAADLRPESAFGVDLGYERRLGRTGVAGLNFFFRDVTDVLEVFNTGAQGSEGPGTFIYSARNTGNGQVYGAEFDLSTSLSAIGLKDTGVFLNYSWLDSKIDDEFGERRFNSQSDFVLNVGFIQDIPAFGAAFGATYRKQGDAESRVVGEEVVTAYGADLEAFVEKRIGGRLTVRLVGSNLLNASKDETFNKFTTFGDQTARNFDEFELESEEAGPVYQLIGRLAF
ncbi:MAG: TonB-dependent receptor, partial [Bryobacteraceae bacterium]|nr:TonB-dependent receptor [Bryobacteraceae bacterium]